MITDDPDVNALLGELAGRVTQVRTEALPAPGPPTDVPGGMALYAAMYDELQRIARTHRARWQGDDTLNTTALVHEAYLKLVNVDGLTDRAHALAIASRAMRQVLVSYAIARHAAKRGGGAAHVPLDEHHLLSDDGADRVMALHEALSRLAARDERAARIVECRFFGGLSADETAEALGLSRATVGRSWRLARAWLHGEITGA